MAIRNERDEFLAFHVMGQPAVPQCPLDDIFANDDNTKGITRQWFRVLIILEFIC
jgi:hypothetical protein